MTEKWIRDTGIVFALLFLFLGSKGYSWGFAISALLLLIVLFVPSLLTPLAWVWLRLTEALGLVMNKVFFGLVFFVVILPVGLLRRLFKGDTRDQRAQPEQESAFQERDHMVVAADLAKPF